jgi:hypothetical protein
MVAVTVTAALLAAVIVTAVMVVIMTAVLAPVAVCMVRVQTSGTATTPGGGALPFGLLGFLLGFLVSGPVAR